MYAAVAHDGKTRSESNASPRMVSAWLERPADHLWIDVPEPTADDLAYLRDRFQLHPLAVEECDHTGVRPKIEEFADHLFLVLHGISHNESEGHLSTVEFKFFLRRGLLISVHDKPSTSIRATQERLQRDPQFLSRCGVDSVLHHIVDALVDHYFPIIEALETRVEDLEGEIFREPLPAQLEEMLHLQRKLLTLRRIIYPQLDILGALSSGRFAEIDAADLVYFRDVYDHLHRISDRLQVAHEMLAVAMQCYLSQSSNRMNAVMKSMAVLATLALPASFLASMLGMNLDHLPGR
ncbi:MAG TPA: magnesium transporter CorA family protein, partial [Armatimonadota bacterium]|nr:magnesium transporter CorA family protein [Armatimonadota bacterium]